MDTYTVRFAYQDEDSAREFKAMDAEDAATDFADWAERELDMWEAPDCWEDEYAVVVTSPDGVVSVWNMNRHYSTRFSARQIDNQ
ncbi:MAG: hypothetical protein DELT_02546 [Desulfovibrio sp.]